MGGFVGVELSFNTVSTGFHSGLAGVSINSTGL